MRITRVRYMLGWLVAALITGTLGSSSALAINCEARPLCDQLQRDEEGPSVRRARAVEKELPLKERVYKKPALKDVAADHITKHTAEIKGKIDPWGSETEYEIWFWPGCFRGSCERLSPSVAKTGKIAAGYSYVSVSVEVTELPESWPNNGYWIVARNMTGESETKERTFKTRGKRRTEI